MRNIARTFARVGRRRMAGALALGGAVLLGSCNQPKLPCGPSNGLFAVKYILKEGAATDACAMLKGDNMTLHPYANGGEGQRPNFKLMPVGMRSERIGNLVAQYKGDDAPELSSPTLSSVGHVTDLEPTDDGFCNVGEVSPTKVMLDPVPADPVKMTEALPGTSIEQDWSNLKIYVTARNNGTQFSADLTYIQDGCTAKYAVRGLYPSIPCEEIVMGPDGKDMGTGKPDETLCSPCADPSKGRGVGSGISPDVATVCDPDTLTCVPANDTPSLLASPTQCM